MSFSEMIRMALCTDIMFATRMAFPKHKFSVDLKMLQDAIRKKGFINAVGEEAFHDFLSRLCFEARKATERWEKNTKKKQKGINR